MVISRMILNAVTFFCINCILRDVRMYYIAFVSNMRVKVNIEKSSCT